MGGRAGGPPAAARPPTWAPGTHARARAGVTIAAAPKVPSGRPGGRPRAVRKPTSAARAAGKGDRPRLAPIPGTCEAAASTQARPSPHLGEGRTSAVGELLLDLRRQRKWSRADLAASMGNTVHTVANLIHGHRLPTLRSALRLARRLQADEVAFARAALQNTCWAEGLDFEVLLRPRRAEVDQPLAPPATIPAPCQLS